MEIGSDTIAAISTPMGQGGIAGIRISGDSAFKIAKKVFFPMSGKKLENMKGYQGAFGNLVDFENNDTPYDKGVCLVYKNPKSYTGEDVVEIFCHGGIFVAEKTLTLLIKSGATPAAAGEFTKRAFLNGKMSLDQAEAVMDIITAKTDGALKMAMSGSEGKLTKDIEDITKTLVDLSAFFGAWFDYPEEGEEEKSAEDIVLILKNVSLKFKKMVDEFHQGKLIKEGIPTAIVGKPNVGKSTMMNLLAREERSIVTNIPGTTRDVIEESIRLNNIVLKLSDTAGIRETDDVVEKKGVEMTLEKIDASTLILAMFDVSTCFDDFDVLLINKLKGKKVLAVVNKIDLAVDKNFKKNINILEDNFENIVYVSAKDKIGMEKFEAMILDTLSLTKFDPMTTILSNQRQYSLVLAAKTHIDEAIAVLENNSFWDMVSFSVEMAIEKLLELTGKTASEEIVNNIFDNFCVGK